MITQTGALAVEDTSSAVSWKAILAGSTASAALTLMLVAFGIGVGFSVISPWGDQGLSATTFTIGGGLYLIVVAMLSSTIGGYLAGRLRSQWRTVHEHERYFRDSAHGFLVWAFATVVSAAVLGGAFTHILSGIGAGVTPAATAAAQNAPTDQYVDALLRTDPTQGRAAAAAASGAQQATSPSSEGQSPAPLQGGQIAGVGASTPTGFGAGLASTRAEIARILAPSMLKNGNVSDADKGYLAKVVVARTGIPQGQAEQRVNQVIAQAKSAADAARKSIATFALWLVASMLAGALSASLAAIEGGNLRNREWYLTDADRARTVAAE